MVALVPDVPNVSDVMWVVAVVAVRSDDGAIECQPERCAVPSSTLSDFVCGRWDWRLFISFHEH